MRALIVVLLAIAWATPLQAFQNGKKHEPPKMVQPHKQDQNQAQGQQQAQQQQQQQKQGQAQGQQQGLHNDISISGPTVEVTGPAIEGVNSDASALSESLSSSSSTVTNEGDTTEISIQGDIFDYPVNTAISPGAFTLIPCGEVFGFASNDGSNAWSLGLPIPRFLSGKQQDCERENDAGWLWSVGLIGESISVRCDKRSMRKKYGSAEDCERELTDQLKTIYVSSDKLAEKDAEIERLKRYADAADDQIYLLQQHEKAAADCKESLRRCEPKAYGGKGVTDN